VRSENRSFKIRHFDDFTDGSERFGGDMVNSPTFTIFGCSDYSSRVVLRKNRVIGAVFARAKGASESVEIPEEGE
jgi:hypothetical protein